jgi:hypothetical protein
MTLSNANKLIDVVLTILALLATLNQTKRGPLAHCIEMIIVSQPVRLAGG